MHHGTSSSPNRALVLGSGGATGIGWISGVLFGLAEAGVDVASADRIIGTSAGSVVGSHLALGRTPAELAEHSGELYTLGRIDWRVVWPFVVSQMLPCRERALRWIGRRASRPTQMSEQEFVELVTSVFPAERDWPHGLGVVVVETTSGRRRLLDSSTGVDIARAAAASSAVPGVFPPVRINGVPCMDGGTRSSLNADLAAGSDRVLAIAPLPGSRRPRLRPEYQLRSLGPAVDWTLITPDEGSARAIGPDPLDASNVKAVIEAGYEQGLREAAAVGAIWA